MEDFAAFISKLENPEHRARMEEVFGWIAERFPQLETKVAWNQPMFTDHGTFIIGFSAAKQHMAVAPEKVTIAHFAEDIVKSSYDHTKELVRIKWTQPVDYTLLEKLIEFNIWDKAECTTFWRK
ncbi:iron chaperone [Paenibacillus tepidiphilus]|uniref:iron chaperone n=1 Tax=Paenibacillus tepidiphilus TaxID=2608683 RepID=UPI00123A87A8|nr:iron chaperone [Paenibacillus tepidiphilus]